MSFPPLLCRDRYPKWLQDVEVTPDGLQIGPIKIPVAQTYDLEHEHDYIMNKALKSYKLYRDKEKAENRQRTLRSARQKRWLTPQPLRNIQSAGPERTRPVIATKDAINEVREANLSEEDIKKNERKSLELNRVNVGRAFELNKITLGGPEMQQSPSPTKSASFIKRNSTSQQWYSQSVPNTSYMKHYNGHAGHQSRHSHSTRVPRSIPASRSETPNRPESAASYSYDGGVFLPNKPKHEYFVIHPDWVSESMTIQKLSLSERKPAYVKSGTWPGRRCKSAPPTKFRNPITWNVESNT